MTAYKSIIVGLRKVSYTRKNGDVVNGSEVHFTYNSPDINGAGAGSCFCRRTDIQLGDEVLVVHDEYQRRYTLVS